MRKANSKNEIQFSCLSDDEKAGSDESDDEINQIDRKKEILNTVVEKLIDKINQPRKPKSIRDRKI